MATSEQCNEAWKNGFIAGHRTVRNTIPPIPPRPASHPGGVDPIDYFYRKGYELGVERARR